MAELVLIRGEGGSGIGLPSFSGLLSLESNKDPFICQVMNKESLKLQSSVSKFPVEKGLEISDNVVTKPRVLTVSGLVSTTSLSQSLLTLGGIFTNGLNGIGTMAAEIAWDKIRGGKSLTNFLELQSHELSKFSHNADASRQLLQEMWVNREVVTALTSVYRFKNMVITDISFPRSSANSHNSLLFNMTLKEIRVAESITKTIATTFKTDEQIAEEAAAAEAVVAREKPIRKGSQASRTLKSMTGGDKK